MSERRYKTPPKNLNSLEQRLRNVVTDTRLQLRTRRQIAYMAVIAALRANASDDDGKPLFAIKGGVAVELLMGLQARATKDLDASARTTTESIEPHLRNSLAEGWDGFTFREACVEIFELRATHSWPPSITVLEGWPRIYAAELRKAPGFEPVDVHEAAYFVNELIAQIDAGGMVAEG